MRALRILSKRYLVANADDCNLGNGISFNMICEAEGYSSVKEFCSKVVLPMGIEAESLVMSAIGRELGINLLVIILDRSAGSELAIEEYLVEGEDKPWVRLQLRPGHYDLMYYHDNSDQTLSPIAVARARPPTFGIDFNSQWQQSTDPNAAEGHTLHMPKGHRPH